MRKLFISFTVAVLLVTLVAVVYAARNNTNRVGVGVPNPSFERADQHDPTQALFWNRDGDPGNHSVSLDDTVSFDGRYSLKLTHGATNGDRPSVTSASFLLDGTPGSAYRIQTYAYEQAANSKVLDIQAEFLDMADRAVSNSPITPYTVIPGWHPYSFSYTPPANARKAVVWVEAEDGGPASIWVDVVSVTALSSASK